MAKFIVNTGPNKEVHKTALIRLGCKINEISPQHRVDTDEDWTIRFPLTYDGCKHCYPEKHRK
ncbi:hypothetical protein [Bacillus infantis]|uniref:hypothetical protein n=1 Tax=Bacillus infantis TaxID=324767 RepID=UPI003CEF005A